MVAVFAGAPALLLVLVLGSLGEGSVLGFMAFVALLCAPPALGITGVVAVAHRVGRRFGRLSAPSTRSLATYAFAMSWTAIALTALGAWGIARSYEDYCLDKAAGLREVGVVHGPDIRLLPPRASCRFDLAGGRAVSREYVSDLYAMLATWLLATIVALGTVHVVLTRLWRAYRPRPGAA